MCKQLMCTEARLVKREEGRHYLLQIRMPHRLIKVGQQGLRKMAVSTETSFNKGTNCPIKGTSRVCNTQATKEGGEGV